MSSILFSSSHKLPWKLSFMNFMREEDLSEILRQVNELYSDITDQVPNISISNYYDAAAGAALSYIKAFLAEFL